MMDRFGKTVELPIFAMLLIGLVTFSQKSMAENNYHFHSFQSLQTSALTDTIPEGKVYHSVGQMPKLKGTLKEFYGHLVYPEKCRQAGIQGTVYVQFIVNKQGNPVHVHILKGIGKSCDQAAFQAVKRYARFIPGKRGGQTVNVQMALPVTFKVRIDPDRVYVRADKMPQLKMPFMELESKVKYPEKCRAENINGRVKLQFIVNKKGVPKNVHVIKGIAAACDSAALVAVKKYARFSRGMIKGRPVNVQMSLSIIFNDFYFPEKVYMIGKYPSNPEISLPKLKMSMHEFESKVKYPRGCAAAGIEGRVIVGFIINKKGMPTHVHVLNGIGGSCDQAAVQAVINYARFIPGKRNGTPVKVRMTIPIVFRLTHSFPTNRNKY